LLVQGADDPYGTLDQLDRIEALVRGPARRVVVPGGHSPHRDATEHVLREIAAFVGEMDDLVRRGQRSEPRGQATG
jgi:pimeloyl-ACP methyl ester carboxylesterase